MSLTTPSRYELFNDQQTKNLAVVVKIAGLSDVFTSRPIYTRVQFGDPGIVYGSPGLVYGGLREYVAEDGSTFRSIIHENGLGSISQRLEPEAGRASISNLSMSFVDQNGFMTELISPGVILDEILGKEVEIFLGYQEISYPHDYIRIYRGYVAGCEAASGIVTLQFSDPNLKRRQKLFTTGKSKTSATILDSDSGAVAWSRLALNEDFHAKILTPQGDFSPDCELYVKVGEEYIRSDFYPDRASRGTVALTHSPGSDVSACIEIQDNAMDLALKLMLSGWGGPFVADIPVQQFEVNPDPNPGSNITHAIVFGPNVDLKRDYGLVDGDYISITGTTNPDNFPEFYPIVRFDDYEYKPNRVAYVSANLRKEPGNTNLKAAFRSQYDTLPKTCGLKLSPRDVDVEQHQYIKRTFAGVGGTILRFFITAEESSGKNFIEDQIYKPTGTYSLTRRGMLSVGITKPPLADQRLVVLDEDNILNPKDLKPGRSVSGRAFFNQIEYRYDTTDEGEFTKIRRTIDSDSISLIGISSSLTIDSRGLRSDQSPEAALDKAAQLTLTRYKRGAVTISPKVNWKAGSLIEAGDVVAVRDEGALMIPNFLTGGRDIGTQLFEVIDRSLDMKSGSVTLKLSAGVGGSANDRYATISPASVVSDGSTASEIIIQDSYGAVFPDDEKRKWKDYIGLKIIVHADDWGDSGVTTLLAFSETNDYAMQVSPPLSFVPQPGYVVELAPYSTSVDPSDQQTAKIIHMFLTACVPVVSGTSTTVLNVDVADVGKFPVGMPILIHNEDWSRNSGEIIVSAVNQGAGEITLKTACAFVPASGDVIEFGSFPDGGGPYRII